MKIKINILLNKMIWRTIFAALLPSDPPQQSRWRDSVIALRKPRNISTFYVPTSDIRRTVGRICDLWSDIFL